MNLPSIKEIVEASETGTDKLHAAVWLPEFRLNDYSDRPVIRILGLTPGKTPQVRISHVVHGLPGGKSSSMLITAPAGISGELKRYARWRRLSTLVATSSSPDGFNVLDVSTGTSKLVSRYAHGWDFCYMMDDSFGKSRRAQAMALNTRVNANDQEAIAMMNELKTAVNYQDELTDWWYYDQLLRQQPDYDVMKMHDAMLQRLGVEVDIVYIDRKAKYDNLFRLSAKAVPKLWLRAVDMAAGDEQLSQLADADTIDRLMVEATESLVTARNAADGCSGYGDDLINAYDALVCVYTMETKENEDVTEL